MNRHAVSAAILLSLSVAYSPAGAGAAEPAFDEIALEFPDEALDRIPVDVDDDGLLDLVWIFHPVDDPEAFGLRTCLQGSVPRFSACSQLDLPDETRAFDVAPLDAEPGAELVLLTRSGALRSSFRHGAFGAPVALPGVLSALGDTDSVVPQALRFLFDLDGDGRAEAVLATRGGIDLHHFLADGSLRTETLASPSHVEIARHRRELDLSAFLGRSYVPHVTTHTTTPAIFVQDLDADGRTDIATIAQNRLRIFAQDATGAFPSAPTAEIERSVITPAEKESGFAGEALTFAELDGDGIIDLIVLEWGSSEERTQMDRHVFLGRRGWEFPETADQIIRSESFFPNFEIRDLNGNGRKDLVVPYFHFAPSQALKVATQNALRIQLRLFLMGPDRRYAQDPGKAFAKVDRRIVLDYHVDVMGLVFGGEGRPSSFDPLLSLAHDFDGDGLPDLVVDDGDDHLDFYWGNPDARYAKRPDLTLDRESSLDSSVADLNGDGRADIVTAHGRRILGWAESKEPERYAKTKRARKREARRRARAGLPTPPEAETRIDVLLSR